MKGKLEFDLPKEQREFEEASRAGEFYGTIQELDQILRRIVKHGDKSDLAIPATYAIKVRSWLRDELQDRGIAHLFP